MQAARRDWLRVDVFVCGWLECHLLVRGFGEDVSATIEFLSFVVSTMMLGFDLVVEDADDVAMLPRLCASVARDCVGIVSRLLLLCCAWLLNRSFEAVIVAEAAHASFLVRVGHVLHVGG